MKNGSQPQPTTMVQGLTSSAMLKESCNALVVPDKYCVRQRLFHEVGSVVPDGADIGYCNHNRTYSVLRTTSRKRRNLKNEQREKTCIFAAVCWCLTFSSKPYHDGRVDFRCLLHSAESHLIICVWLLGHVIVSSRTCSSDLLTE